MIDSAQLLLLLQDAADTGFCENAPLSQLTSFQTGGNCALAVFPRTAEALQSALCLLRREGVPALVLGRGSNVLAPDEGYDGVVLFTTAQNEKPSMCGNTILAPAGAALNVLALAAQEASLSGLECLYGIPGTVGGALYMNAGAYDAQFSDLVVSSEALDEQGERRVLTAAAHAFDYRESVYQHRPLTALVCTLQLRPGDKTQIRKKMDEILKKRKHSQPLEYPSAGSVFKRPAGHYAGSLIEKAGLKGVKVGAAQVSEKHAGFLINTGGATSADVKALIALVQKTVFERFGVALSRELQYLEELCVR